MGVLLKNKLVKKINKYKKLNAGVWVNTVQTGSGRTGAHMAKQDIAKPGNIHKKTSTGL